MKSNKKNVAFLISGKGTNLLKILSKNLNEDKFNTISIISNNQISDEIKFFVKKNKLSIFFFEKISKINHQYIKSCDLIFSVGYMKIINNKIINNFNIINLHPSILPKYKGVMTQKRMLINKEKKFGFTIHKVTTELDNGTVISKKERSIKTNSEKKLFNDHKELEYKFVYKELIRYLN